MSINYDHKAIQMRRGTSSEWREYGDKCVPLEAEICVELMQYPDGTINKNVGVKVGNGIDSYEQLPYVILNEEVDPVFTNHPAFEITQDMIDSWNQSSVKPGEVLGQVTRWDGEEWSPSDFILLRDVEGILVTRHIIPGKASKIDIGSEDEKFRDGYFENLNAKDINVEGSINVGGEIIGGDNGINIGSEIDNLKDALDQEIDDRKEGDNTINDRIDNLAIDDLTDVVSKDPEKDYFLIYNGAKWEAEEFHIDTELRFKGGISVVSDPAPATKENGDLYINNEEGIVGDTWIGIAGETINEANAVGWSATNARWYKLGDIASAAVLEVKSGEGIYVDSNDPAEPIVNIDRDEVDKWYADFNHNHDGVYLKEEVDPTVPEWVKDITQSDIDKWNDAYGWGDGSDKVSKTDTNNQSIVSNLTSSKNISADKFIGDGSSLINITTDQLSDVTSADARQDEFLIFNGTQWEAQPFYLETELTYQGAISCVSDPAPAANNGDLYINNEEGEVGSSWTGIAGTQIKEAVAVGWAEKKGRWYILGDIASNAVLSVGQGTAITVNSSDPANPVVSVEESFYKKWEEAHGWGDHSQEGYLKSGDVPDVDQSDKISKTDTNDQQVVSNFKSLKNITAAKFVGDGSSLTGITTNQLSDVSSASAKKDDFLIHNGSNWVAEAFHIDTELTYQGAWNLTAAPPTTKNNGDLYINNTDGVVHSGWAGIAGTTVREGNVVGWAASKNRWYLLGDIASSSVTEVKGGTGITVNSNEPAKPIVNLDLATASTRGGVKIGYSANGKNYPVQLSNEQMYVSVPWTDTNNVPDGSRSGDTLQWQQNNGWVISQGFSTDDIANETAVSTKTFDFYGNGAGSKATFHVNTSVNGVMEATTVKKAGGTANQLLCADGSVVDKGSVGGDTDLTGYATEAWVTTNHYQKTETKKNVVMTEAQYNALGSKDAETIYFLT